MRAFCLVVATLLLLSCGSPSGFVRLGVHRFQVASTDTVAGAEVHATTSGPGKVDLIADSAGTWSVGSLSLLIHGVERTLAMPPSSAASVLALPSGRYEADMPYTVSAVRLTRGIAGGELRRTLDAAGRFDEVQVVATLRFRADAPAAPSTTSVVRFHLERSGPQPFPALLHRR